MLKFGVRGEFLRAITCGVQKKALTLQRIWERQRALRGNKVFKDAENDSVAQLVEQMTLNHWVVGSSPTGVTPKRAEIARFRLFLRNIVKVGRGYNYRPELMLW